MVQHNPAGPRRALSALPRLSRLIAVASMGIVLAACSGSPSTPARCDIALPRLTTGHLHSDGTRLLDEIGRQVFLRGLNAGSRAKWAPYAPFDFALPDPGGASYRAALAKYLDGAVAMGANVLRVPFSWQALEPVRGQLDEAYLARYDALLDAAWARGIRTLVDFHQDVYAENFCGDGFPAWTIDATGGPPPASHHDCPRWFEAYSDAPVMAAFDRFWADTGGVQTDFVAMWKRMLARHRDRPGVIGFEPLNEPSPGSTERVAFEATTLTAFHSKMAALVNAEAPGALVFFDPVGIVSATHVTHLGLPAGKGLVYAPHYYQAGTIFGGTGNDKQIAADLTTLMSPARKWGVPTFVGEWGAGNEADDAADYVAAHLAAFDELGLSGTQWEYSVNKERWNDEPLDVAWSDGTLRPVADGWSRPSVVAVAGTVIEATWDADSFRLTLRYRPSTQVAAGAGSVTEVALGGSLWHVDELEGGCLSEEGGVAGITAQGPAEVLVVIRPHLGIR